MAKDAFYFLIPIIAAAVSAFALGWAEAGFAVAGLGLFVAWFFRDPYRQIPADPGLIVSPADGRIVRIEREGENTRISIFLSIFNVHINRAPIAGRIEAVRYQKGRFLAAFNDLASAENEQNTLTIQGEHIRVECSQIAGLVARRIVCRVRPGDRIERGDRFGLIRFGSRADLVLPPSVEVNVRIGDRIRGGSSIIGRLHASNRSPTP